MMKMMEKPWEEQETCDGRTFFVTFSKPVYPINIIKTNH